MTRRTQHYDNLNWQPWLIVAEVGALVIAAGILATIAQLVVSIRTREQRRDLTGDPWNGRTLEWSTASPPPEYNFAVLPNVEEADAYWNMKQRGLIANRQPHYEAIEMPGRSPNGFITAFFAVVTGFGLIWHIWLLAGIGFGCAVLTLLVFGWVERKEKEVAPQELLEAERARVRQMEPA